MSLGSYNSWRGHPKGICLLGSCLLVLYISNNQSMETHLFTFISNTLSRTLDSPLTRLQNSPSSTTPEANPLRRQTELAEFASNETRRELYRDRGRTKKSEATEARCLRTTMAKANSWRIHEFAQRKKKSKYCDGASISTSPCIDPSQA